MTSLLREFAQFVRENKRFVVVPLVVLIVVLLLAALLARGGGSPYGYEIL